MLYILLTNVYISSGFQPWCVWTFSATPWRSVIATLLEGDRQVLDCHDEAWW